MVTSAPIRKRRRTIAVALGAVVVLVYGLVIYALTITPDYRTTLLVDTSEDIPADAFAAITGAVASVANNTPGADSLSLRRFGGRCGDPGNTAEVVGAGLGHGREVADNARGLVASGDATLLSGVLAAIDDYADFYPFRGTERNRIIVVTTHGVDACGNGDISRTIQERAAAAGLTLDFRFVGLTVPADEQAGLTQLASASSAPAPVFVDDPAELAETLEELTVPEAPDARRIDPPDTTTSAPPPPQQALVHVTVVATDWNVTVTTDAPDIAPCTPSGVGEEACEFLLPAGTLVRLQADISGAVPPLNREFNGTPAWFGCDESPSEPSPFDPNADWTVGDTANTFRNATQTCTLALDTGRAVCLGTTDLQDGGATAACAGIWSENPRIRIPLGATTIGSLPTGSTTEPTAPEDEVVVNVRIYGNISTVTAGETPCGPNTAPHGPPLCSLVLPADGGTEGVQAVPVNGVQISPTWYGCNEPPGSGLCSIPLTGDRYLCVDSGDGSGESPCLTEPVGPEPSG